jgi:hypothetical protein
MRHFTLDRNAYFTAAVLALVFALAGCQAVQSVDAVSPAVESGKPELIAYALEGSYTIVQSQAVKLAQEPDTPQAVRDVFIAVAERANPILDKARPLAVEAEGLRAKLASGESVETRLAAVLADLNRLLSEVSPLITDMVNAIKGTADQGDQP